MRTQFLQTHESISVDELTPIIIVAAPNALIEAGRGYYLQVSESDLATFLKDTKIDRYIWEEFQPKGDLPEMVCTSFSLLLWALLEQERLRQRLAFPFAIARVRLVTENGSGHSLCGFVNEAGVFKFIEPQNDQIYTPLPGQNIQAVIFQ